MYPPLCKKRGKRGRRLRVYIVFTSPLTLSSHSMPASYSTCALYLDGGGGASLNPFTRSEYEAQCKDANASVSVCKVPSSSSLHPSLVGQCAKRAGEEGTYTLDSKCVAAMRSAPDSSLPAPAAPHDPLFAEAELCRTKMGGSFHSMCGKREVAYHDLASKIGAKCDQCCETVVQRDQSKQQQQHDHHHRDAHHTSPFPPF